METPTSSPPWTTASTKSGSPAPVSSPKRKRSDSFEGPHRVPDPLLRIDTNAARDSDIHNVPILDSPRSKVAERLQSLDIRPVRPLKLDPRTSPEPRKRLKSSLDDRDDFVYCKKSPAVLQTPIHRPSGASDDGLLNSEVNEIAETPDVRAPEPRYPIDSPRRQIHREIACVNIESAPPEREPPEAHSPPAHEPSSSPTRTVEAPGRDLSSILDSSPVFHDHNSDLIPSPSPSLLTWQDSEITGHDIDRNLSDDDGEGINGIGFRPTAAQAHQRSTQRRQQVSDWRAREAREARQRRIERRRVRGVENGSGSPIAVNALGSGERKRVVRFAEVG